MRGYGLKKVAKVSGEILKGTASLIVGSTVCSVVMAIRPTEDIRVDSALALGAGGVTSAIVYNGIEYMADDFNGTHPKQYSMGGAREAAEGKEWRRE